MILKIALKLMVNKRLKCLRKVNMWNSKIWKNKNKITIHVSILVPEDNGKQNPNESYTIKYQKHVACSYGYKLVCVDHKFSNRILTKVMFTILLAVWSKIVNILAKNLWWLKKIIKIFWEFY